MWGGKGEARHQSPCGEGETKDRDCHKIMKECEGLGNLGGIESQNRGSVWRQSRDALGTKKNWKNRTPSDAQSPGGGAQRFRDSGKRRHSRVGADG